MKGLIFDVDGTIADSMWVWLKADSDAVKKYGYEIDDEYKKHASRLNNRQCVEYIIERYKLDVDVETLADEINSAAFEQYRKNVQLKEGAAQFIKEMKKRGHKLAVATSCLRPMCEHLLKSKGIFECFDGIVYSDEFGKNKLSPDIYIEAARIINEKPENCVVFEDIPSAAQSAVNAGMKVVGIYDEFSKEHEELMKKICHVYIKSFHEFCTKINILGQ
ncbi:MAG: HAD family phosphatase [Firmicutes bacterium]|nr:HAD family phosphatase [Bacillota bacterium]